MNDERKIRVIPATNSRRLFVDDDSPIKMQKKKGLLQERFLLPKIKEVCPEGRYGRR